MFDLKFFALISKSLATAQKEIGLTCLNMHEGHLAMRRHRRQRRAGPGLTVKDLKKENEDCLSITLCEYLRYFDIKVAWSREHFGEPGGYSGERSIFR